MNKVYSLIKKVAKAYFKQSSKTYIWLPTGTFPIGV